MNFDFSSVLVENPGSDPPLVEVKDVLEPPPEPEPEPEAIPSKLKDGMPDAEKLEAIDVILQDGWRKVEALEKKHYNSTDHLIYWITLLKEMQELIPDRYTATIQNVSSQIEEEERILENRKKRLSRY